MQEFISENTEDTCDIARKVGIALDAGNKAGSARILGLVGDLGAGKTTFTKELARSLGVKEDVSSPTFVILRRYGLSGRSFKNLFHIDLYRLSDPKEIDVLGWPSVASNPDNLIVIEWPQNVAGTLPENSPVITFEHLGDNKRKITVNNLTLDNGSQKNSKKQ